ncbi:hypothetical protein [Enterococcus sp. AZ109]|uniref:hypothetical protein n=1 Tax=Enterococcus sp. AZ109 TaxID=2774634 RepID=UPI003F27EC81
MISPVHFGKIVNFLINFFLGVTLVTVGLLLSEHLTFLNFIQSFVVSMGVGYLICDFIPAPQWGQKLAQTLNIENKIIYHLVSTAVGGLVLITCISFFCQFIAVGNLLFVVWPKALPYLLLSGYLVLVIFMPVCQKIAAVLTEE